MLDFLATATINDMAEKTVVRKGGPRKQRNPEGLAIRVFHDGSVYPSQELVDKFNLEYAAKDSDDSNNGFDIIDIALYPTFQLGKRILIISPVSRKNGKVDLFGSTTYNEDGSPKTSVLEQGSKTFGMDDLIPAIQEIYNISMDKESGVEFVDLVLVANPATGEPWTLPQGKTITYIPKKVSRGAAKGTVSTIRRENPLFYAFLPLEMTQGEATEQKEEEVTELPTAPAPVELPIEESAVTALPVEGTLQASATANPFEAAPAV